MNNDIVKKSRLNAALGTEGNMGFEHNDIVTVDKMNEAIAEGGGGGDFSTAEVTFVNNGSDEYGGGITHLETFPQTDIEVLTEEIFIGAGDSSTYTCALYKGNAVFMAGPGWTATVEGDAEQVGSTIFIAGNCTITLTAAG